MDAAVLYQRILARSALEWLEEDLTFVSEAMSFATTASKVTRWLWLMRHWPLTWTRWSILEGWCSVHENWILNPMRWISFRSFGPTLLIRDGHLQDYRSRHTHWLTQFENLFQKLHPRQMKQRWSTVVLHYWNSKLGLTHDRTAVTCE